MSKPTAVMSCLGVATAAMLLGSQPATQQSIPA